MSEFNDKQREVIQKINGPKLILAGAGTGKTTTLVHRVANILHNEQVRPYQVLIVTFNNKAAQEIETRLTKLVHCAAHDLCTGTFHAIAAKILRKHAKSVALHADFVIIDSDEQVSLLQSIVQTLLNTQELKDICSESNSTVKALAKRVSRVIQSYKDNNILPKQEQHISLNTIEYCDAIISLAKRVYIIYQERLQKSNTVDFGDLLLYNVAIFQNNPAVLTSYQERFRYIMVDEYQDSNYIQHLWLCLLAAKHRNICCVGDDDQAIYGWRGARVENMLGFAQDFTGTEIIKLEENYRSTPHILATAANLIAHNRHRLEKTLWTRRESFQKVMVWEFTDSYREVNYIAQEIKKLLHIPELSDIAILVRNNFQTRIFEEVLRTYKIPYCVIGGIGFYERKEIKDLISYLRLVHNPDDDIAFIRIVNVPARGIGPAKLKKISRKAMDTKLSLYQAAKQLVQANDFKGKQAQPLKDFLDMIDNWRDLLTTYSCIEVMQNIVREIDYLAMFSDARHKINNVLELYNVIARYNDLADFLEHVNFMYQENDPNNLKAKLMTLYRAKGLEFSCVFLPKWQKGYFPYESNTRDTEEERRLAYVGITRAKHKLFISYACNERDEPSPFITELPLEHIDIFDIS